jgi:hypothetical protein
VLRHAIALLPVLAQSLLLLLLLLLLRAQINTHNWNYSYQPLSISNPSPGGAVLGVRLYLIPKLTFYLWSVTGVSVYPLPYIGVQLFRNPAELPGVIAGGIALNLSASTGPQTPVTPVVRQLGYSSVVLDITPPAGASANLSAGGITGYQVSCCCTLCVYIFTVCCACVCTAAEHC